MLRLKLEFASVACAQLGSRWVVDGVEVDHGEVDVECVMRTSLNEVAGQWQLEEGGMTKSKGVVLRGQAHASQLPRRPIFTGHVRKRRPPFTRDGESFVSRTISRDG